jgi:hypothetical protein
MYSPSLKINLYVYNILSACRFRPLARRDTSALTICEMDRFYFLRGNVVDLIMVGMSAIRYR